MIPGIIISFLTFPGVIVHEAAHMFFCKLRGVAVLEAVFFQVDPDGNIFSDTPVGYVIHEDTDNFVSSFLISMGPFFINTFLCLIICFPAYMPISYFDLGHPLSYFLMWLGLSIGMHAIPSNQDANNLIEQAKEKAKSGNLLAIISFPLIALVYVLNFLSFVWADLIYGAAIGIGIPSLFF